MAQVLSQAGSFTSSLRGLGVSTCTNQRQFRSASSSRHACAYLSGRHFPSQIISSVSFAQKVRALVGRIPSTQWPETVQRRSCSVRAAAKEETGLEKESDGPPVQLGTAELPEDINLPRLKAMLYQWANSIVTSSALPLPLPLKVDSLDDGVRLAFIRIESGEISELFNIDVLLSPKTEGERRPMFRVIRDGQYKNTKAAFEPQVMSSLLAALKKAVPLSRGE